MSYEVELTEQAFGALRRLRGPLRAQIAERVEKLADDPTPPASRRLHGRLEGLRRLRIGDYRAIYRVDQQAQTVVVLRVGHRHNVYKD